MAVDPLVVTVTPNPAIGTVPFTSTATVSVTGGKGGGAATVAMDWGDGGTTAAGSSLTPSHSYTVAGTYTATATVVDQAFTDTFTGTDGASIDTTKWTTSATGGGTVVYNSNKARFTVPMTSSASARLLPAMFTSADQEVLFSLTIPDTGARGYFFPWVRGSGDWTSANRPTNGYGIQIQTDSATVILVKSVANALSTLQTTTSATSTVANTKQWFRMRAEGTVISWRTWVDGASEPGTWNVSYTDTGATGGAAVTAAGKVQFVATYSGATTAIKTYDLDDVTAGQINVSASSATGTNTVTANGAVVALSVSTSVDSSTVSVSTAANLTGTASGGSGTKTYAWTKVSGPTGSFGSASSATSTYTPTVAGSHALRLTVTDSSGSALSNITVTAVDSLAFTTVSASGWTAAGGTAAAVLADTSDATYLESADNPTAQTFDLTLPAIAPPGGDLLLPGRFQRVAGSSGSLVATLRDGTTTVATSNTVTPSTTAGAGTFTFLASDLVGVSTAKWNAGTMVIRVSATAAP